MNKIKEMNSKIERLPEKMAFEISSLVEESRTKEPETETEEMILSILFPDGIENADYQCSTSDLEKMINLFEETEEVEKAELYFEALDNLFFGQVSLMIEKIYEDEDLSTPE